MSKEAKIIIFAIVTMVLNILAPILMINLYKDYTAESFIIGSPDKSVVITEYVEPKDYLYQENLSNLTFVQEDEYWVASYNFEDKEFDINKTYAIFVNDYICTPVEVLGSKVSGTHTIKFNDINGNTLDTTKMSIDFEFYTTYSSILLKVETADISYFNGFKQNPGFILTLSEIDPNLLEIVKNTSTIITPEEPVDENVVAVTFKSYDDTTLNTYYVEKGNTLTTLPDEPTRAGYVFTGWTLDGTNIVDDLSTLTFVENTELTAVFEEIIFDSPTLLAVTWNGIEELNGASIWTDGQNIYSDDEYVLNTETLTWEPKTWNGLTEFHSSNIWTDGVRYFLSQWDEHYELEVATSTWIKKTWSGLTEFFGQHIWTDGTNYYCSYGNKQYVLDIETSTWSPKVWNGFVPKNGGCIWTDGTNYYYSQSSNGIPGYNYQYVLDKETSTWTEKEWGGLSNPHIESIWTDGINIYCSSYQQQSVQDYVLDIEHSYWNKMTCSDIYGYYIWTDGTNYYYSYDDEQYVILFPYKDYPVTVNLHTATLVSCSNDYTVDDDGNIVCRAGSSIIVTYGDIDVSWSVTNCTVEEYDDGDDTINSYIVYVGGLGNSAEVIWSAVGLKKDEQDNLTGLVD